MTVRLRVKSIVSSDVDVDEWTPGSLEDVYFPLELEIGLAGAESASLFQLLVATPEGLRRYARTEIISERGLLVLSEFSWQIVHETLDRIIVGCAGNSWQETTVRLQRYFTWEYEDYVESKWPGE
jgi:hypothetical protein